MSTGRSDDSQTKTSPKEGNNPNDEQIGLLNILNSIELAHTIAVDPNFTIPDYDQENSIHFMVKKTMHDCFWDIFSQQINETPPNFCQAPSLFQELKSFLLDVISVKDVDLRAKVETILDEDAMRGQLERESFNLGEYVDFVIEVMASQCAPARDEIVRGLADFKDRPTLLFRNLFETLTLLRRDLTNFSIRRWRPQIVAQSITNEQQNFSLLFDNGDQELKNTKKWLSEALDRCRGDTSARNILNNAYVDLLKISARTDYPFPETFILDIDRLYAMSEKTLKLCLFCTIVPFVGSFFQGSQKNELLNICYSKLVKSFPENISYRNMTENVEESLSIITEIIISLFKENSADFPRDEIMAGIRDELSPNGSRRVFNLIYERVRDYFGIFLSSGDPVQCPRGMLMACEELLRVADRWEKVVAYNRLVFGKWYNEIIQQLKDS